MKKSRISLFRAFRVFDDHARHPQAHQRQAHRHAMVVDRWRSAAPCSGPGVIRRPSGSSSTFAPSFAARSPGCQSGRSPCGDYVQRRVIVVGPVAKSATAASVCTVSLIAFMLTSIPRSGLPIDGDRVVLVPHLAAHLRKTVGEFDIALQAALRKSFNGDFAAGDRRRRQKITRGGSVRLDRVFAARVFFLRQCETRKIVRGDIHAE